MKLLREKLVAQFEAQRAEIGALVSEHGDEVISDVSVSQLAGGLRGVIGAVCDTSEVDPQRGLLIRGRPVKELAFGITAEQVFLLLLTGEDPASDSYDPSLLSELLDKQDQRREDISLDLLAGLGALREDTHPVVALCHALQLLQARSRFAAAYDSMPRQQLWEAALEDALIILAALPTIVRAVYRGDCSAGFDAPADDWAARLAETLDPSLPDGLVELMRLYALVHCDHEGSNACAYACAATASTLADPYLALTAGYRALAGPIHGLAAQTCVEFVERVLEEYGGVPDDAQLAGLVEQRLAQRQIIPGFGHAVLRAMDPRYELLHEFAAQHFPEDDGFRVADGLLRVVPPLLSASGKVSNPWPNVDGISGVVLRHYGLRDYRLLTVLFATCFSLGLLAQYVIARGIGAPLLRPRSITTARLSSLLSS